MITQPNIVSPAGTRASLDGLTRQVTERRRPPFRRTVRRQLRVLIIFVVGLLLALPLLYLVSASLMSDSQLTSYPPALIPSHLHFANYAAAWNLPDSTISAQLGDLHGRCCRAAMDAMRVRGSRAGQDAVPAA